MFLPVPSSPLSLSLSLFVLSSSHCCFLAFVFGRGRLCRCHVLGEADCVLPPLRRITSSTWASWGCSEQLVSSSCSGRERPSESCCGPSSSPSRYSAVNRYTHDVRMVTIHVLPYYKYSFISDLWQALPYVCLLIAMLFFIYAIIGMQVSAACQPMCDYFTWCVGLIVQLRRSVSFPCGGRNIHNLQLGTTMLKLQIKAL